MLGVFGARVRSPYKANVEDNPRPGVVPGLFVGVIKTKKYFPIFHSLTKTGLAAWEAQSRRPVWLCCGSNSFQMLALLGGSWSNLVTGELHLINSVSAVDQGEERLALRV